jgi:membrane fusion protein, multidrug efflux system
MIRVRSELFVLSAVVLSTATGCSSSSAAPPAPSETAPSAKVTTAAVGTRPIATYLSLTGQLKSGRETDLAANASGRVTTTSVERGARVKAGDVLATLDVRAAALSAAEARANAETAAASAESANTECERTRSLVASGALGKADLDRVEAQCKTTTFAVSAAKARSQLAAQNVGDGVIRAPFGGVVTERYVDVGEYVRQDTRVVTLVDLAALRLEITIPETHIAAARAGAKVTFSVAGYPDKTFTGSLKFVGASVRSSTRDVVVEATLDDGADAALLRPGMFASVRLSTGDEKKPVVPTSALTTRDGKPTAFVVVDGRIEQRIVQTGDALGDETAIMRGVAEGEHIVLTPAPTLKNGVRVSGS